MSKEKLDLKFTIIYSSYSSLTLVYDQLYDLDFYDLIDICQKKKINSLEIEGLDRSDLCEFLSCNQEVVDDFVKDFSLGIPRYIIDNPELFKLTESDNNCDELGLDYNTILRKYFAVLNIKQFIEFVGEYGGYSTCNTMGMLTPYGLLAAFSIESDSSEIYEHLYVSISYSKEIKESEMIQIEDNIRTMIENDELTEESVEELLTKFGK